MNTMSQCHNYNDYFVYIYVSILKFIYYLYCCHYIMSENKKVNIIFKKGKNQK